MSMRTIAPRTLFMMCCMSKIKIVNMNSKDIERTRRFVKAERSLIYEDKLTTSYPLRLFPLFFNCDVSLLL